MKQVNPNVVIPVKIERLVMSCLNKDSDQRPSRLKNWLQDFAGSLRGGAIGLRVDTHEQVVDSLPCPFPSRLSRFVA